MSEFPLGAVPERLRHPKFSADRLKRSPKPFKPKAWSHQQDLKDLVGKRVDILLLSGIQIEATLVEADAFTLKTKDGVCASLNLYDKSTLTYFKHAILCYGPVTE